MSIEVSNEDRETYLYLNGIEVPRPIKLGDSIEIQPSKCAPNQDLIIELFKTSHDIGVAAIFLYQIRTQIKIRANEPQDLAIKAWSSIWDGIMLSAFFDTEAVCNFQSNTSADLLNEKSRIRITNYHLRGLQFDGNKCISESDCIWVEENYTALNELGKDSLFQNGMNALSNYRWHLQPRIRLAIIWAGIEGLFKIDSELSFRLSLYAAKLLYPNDAALRKAKFEKVKKLYRQRSLAVHGAEIKGDSKTFVEESANLLRDILKKCVENKSFPLAEDLAP